MKIKECITGYCPKLNRDLIICINYITGSTLAADYKIPDSFECSYSHFEPVCTKCEIFDSIL